MASAAILCKMIRMGDTSSDWRRRPDAATAVGLVLGLALGLAPFAMRLMRPLDLHAPWLVVLGIVFVVAAVARHRRAGDINWVPFWLGVVILVCVSLGASLAMLWFRDEPGEGQIRLHLEVGIVVASLYPLYVVASAPESTPPRGGWLASVGTIALLLTFWASLDQAAPLRAMPEFELAYPGATELRSASGGSEGRGFKTLYTPPRASWWFETGASADEVLAFYDSELTSRGWTTRGTGSYGIGLSCHETAAWRKGDAVLTVRLQDGTDSPRCGASDTVVVTLIGPVDIPPSP